MRIAFGTDQPTPVTAAIVIWLAESGHDVAVVADGEAWTTAGRLVGEAVTTGGSDLGVACCFTGTGVSIAANKVPGARAALCVDAETARGARRWNDANVLALSLRLTTVAVATEVLAAFLDTEAERSEADRVAELS